MAVDEQASFFQACSSLWGLAWIPGRQPFQWTMLLVDVPSPLSFTGKEWVGGSPPPTHFGRPRSGHQAGEVPGLKRAVFSREMFLRHR